MDASKWEDECAPDCVERAECTEVGDGHTMCGTCVCGTPRHHCIDRSHQEAS